MINYFRSALRRIFNNRIFSIVNISGLAIGIASFIAIMLYVDYEKSYDSFFTESENIYRVYIDCKKGKSFEPCDAQTYNLSGPTLQDHFPEIKQFVRLFQLDRATFVHNNKTFEIKNGQLADTSYFNVFASPINEGSSVEMLKEPNSIVLTKRVAEKIFGRDNAVGEVLEVYHNQIKTELIVKGIIEDVPENTHMKTNFLVSFNTIENWQVCRSDLNWENNEFFTYILIDKNTELQELRSKIVKFKGPYEEERHNIEALTDIHLYSNKPYEAEPNGNARNVSFLLAISIIIMLLSWLNYINLSTTQSLERTKEIAIRKVIGANKVQLVIQLLVESFLINVIAILLSLVVLFSLLPFIESFIGQGYLKGVFSVERFTLYLSFIFTGALIAGLYPALVLSNSKPVRNLNSKGYSIILKVLVIGQFAATIILLIGAFTISQQLRFVQNQNLGFNANKLVSINGDILNNQESNAKQFQILKTELKKLPFIKSVASSETYPGQGYFYLSYSVGINYPDGTADNNSYWYNYAADHDFIPMLNFKLLAGSNFRENSKLNNQVIINETAAKRMNIFDYDEAINQVIGFQSEDWEIVGIIKDYHHFGLNDKIEPFIISYKPICESNIIVEFNNNIKSVASINNAINKIEKEWKQVFVRSTFKYQFLDEEFQAQYKEDKIFKKAFSIFTVLAIFIASLGLFGLASYSCSKRTKEIGVRKVNGAREIDILGLLNIEYIRWIAISFVIAMPIAWHIMNNWLENFAHRIELYWWIFILSAIMAFSIAILTVTWQSWRAARQNPVESLRYE